MISPAHDPTLRILRLARSSIGTLPVTLHVEDERIRDNMTLHNQLENISFDLTTEREFYRSAENARQRLSEPAD